MSERKRRPHYVYVVMIEGEIKKVTTCEMNARAYLGSIGSKYWSQEGREAISKWDLDTGERVRGRQCLQN